MADIVTTKRIIELPDASQDITENDYFAIDNENGDTGKIPANLFTSTSREAKLYDNTKTYAVGDHCIHQNKYYVCTTAIETPEVWTAAYWEQTDIGDEITELNNTLATKLIAREIPSNKFTWDTNWFKATNFDLSGMTVLGFIVKPLNGSAIMNAYLASSTDLRVIGWVPSNGTNITSAYTFVCWAIGYATA